MLDAISPRRLAAVGLTLALTMGLFACISQPTTPTNDDPDPPDPPVYTPEPAPQVPDVAVPEFALPAQAFLDRSLDLRNYSSAQLDEIAACPVAVFQLRLLMSEEGYPVVQELRRRNPDLVLIGIHQVLSLPEHWDDPNQRSRFPLSAELFDVFTWHRAQTNLGEPAWRWPGNVTINPFQNGGGYNLDLLRTQQDIISRHAMTYPDAIDGVFHDFLSWRPWLYAGQDNPVEGSTDFDNDGVFTEEDDDELAAWYAWQFELVEDFQRRFGPGLIQVANGRLPHDDPAVAAKISGIVYEFWPNTPWWLTDRAGFERLLTHMEPGYLTPRRGRTWNLLWDTNGNRTEFARVSSAMTGQPYMLRDSGGFAGRDTGLPVLGAPTGPMTRVDHPSGQVSFHRAFEQGAAVIDTYASGSTQRSEFTAKR